MSIDELGLQWTAPAGWMAGRFGGCGAVSVWLETRFAGAQWRRQARWRNGGSTMAAPDQDNGMDVGAGGGGGGGEETDDPEGSVELDRTLFHLSRN
jgi:hypothetical protein